jgi:hypothetical protein
MGVSRKKEGHLGKFNEEKIIIMAGVSPQNNGFRGVLRPSPPPQSTLPP